MKNSRLFQITAGLLLAALGLRIFSRDLDLKDLVARIGSTPFSVIVAAIILSIGTLWLRALRWRILLPLSPKTHKKSLFPIVVVSYMANNIMPARLGEALRVILLWRKNSYTLTTSIGSLFLERIIDSLVYLSFFFIPVFLSNKLSHLIPYARVVAAVFALCCAGFIAYAVFPSKFIRLLSWLSDRLPEKAGNFLNNKTKEVMCNLDWVFSPVKVAAVVSLSIIIGFTYSAVILLLAAGSSSLGLLDSLFGQAFAAFGSAIPLTPGYVGTLHAALRQGLELTGVSGESAAAIVILYHALPFITVTLSGLFFLIGTDITFKDISHAKEQLKTSKLESENEIF